MSQGWPGMKRAYPRDVAARRCPTRATPPSPPPSTSSATCTSSTAPSSTAWSPTATRPRRVRDAPMSVSALTREGRVTAAGHRQDAGGEAPRAAGDRDDPGRREAAREVPAGLIDLTRLPGLGPKRARRLFDELGIDSLEALREAAEGQKLRGVKGFGPKFEESVLAAFAAGVPSEAAPRLLLQQGDRARRRDRRGAARAPGRGARRAGRRRPPAGRQRQGPRHRRRVRRPARAVPPRWPARPRRAERPRPARTPRAARTHNGVSLDLRVVAPDQFGNLLQHFTGSKQHNMELRERAVRKGLHVSEYGIPTTRPARRCAARPRRRSMPASA